VDVFCIHGIQTGIQLGIPVAGDPGDITSLCTNFELTLFERMKGTVYLAKI
jgi:hypothetical protein